VGDGTDGNALRRLVAYVERCGEAGVDEAEVSQFTAKAMDAGSARVPNWWLRSVTRPSLTANEQLPLAWFGFPISW
jgi:hypothetical protein